MPHISRRGLGRPPAAKAADTRERIVRAAREVFGELGYEAATFQAIAVRADLTRPAINHYFDSKLVLYREVLEQTNAVILNAAVARVQRESSLIDRVSTFIDMVTQSDADDRPAAAFLVTSVMEARRHSELRDGEHDLVQVTRAFLRWAVDDAVRRGELSADTDTSAVVAMLVAVLLGAGFYAGFVADRGRLDPMIDQLKCLLAGHLRRPASDTTAAKPSRRLVKLSELKPRTDAPPL